MDSNMLKLVALLEISGKISHKSLIIQKKGELKQKKKTKKKKKKRTNNQNINKRERD